MFLKMYKLGRNQLPFYLLTILVLLIFFFLLQYPLHEYLMYAVDTYDDVSFDMYLAFQDNPDFTTFHLNKNIGLILMILPFAAAWIALWISMKFFHCRPFTSLITAANTINWGKIFFAFGVFIGLSLTYDILSYLLHPESYTFQFNIKALIPLILIGLLILPIQTTAEELIFRGYLLQGFTSWVKEPWIALLITSILFGLIHGQNPEIGEYGVAPMMFYYIGAGLFLGVLTIFDDSLELAIGVHAAINFYSAIVSSYTGAVLQTDTILKTSQMNPWLANFVLVLAFLIFFYICSKKYNWPTIENLFKKLENSKPVNT